VLVAGVGNAWRGDDAAGLLVVRRLAALLGEGVRTVELEGEPVRLLDHWEEGVEATFVVDTVRTGSPPGTVLRLDVAAAALPASLSQRGSTHHLGLADAIELARRLGRLPSTAVVYGVEGERFDASGELTPAVERALPEVAEAVAREIRQWSGGAGAR
jgi:hydrogenase maturation protease